MFPKPMIEKSVLLRDYLEMTQGDKYLDPIMTTSYSPLPRISETFDARCFRSSEEEEDSGTYYTDQTRNITCSICHQKCKTPAGLRQHISKTHKEDQKYRKCSLCGRNYFINAKGIQPRPTIN